MSKKKESSGVGKSSSPKIKRPGVHSKKKSSNSKNSKNYKKKYRGQG
jgi:hypothetical protein